MLKIFLVGMMVTLTAGFGLVAWISLRPPPAVVTADAPAPPPPPAKSMVLAAARVLRPGELVKAEDIGAVEMPTATLPEGAQVDSPAARAELAGAMVRRNLAAQQPVLPGDMLRPTDGGFLAAVMTKNYRAVSIAVDSVSGTAGLIWPGDRVDLILTQTNDDASVPMGRRTFGETVLRDVRVIAVDQQLARGISPDAALSASSQGNRTVTLEVLPEAAERVAVAMRLGKVALSVRAFGAVEPSEPGSADSVVQAQNPLQAAHRPLVRTVAQVAAMVPAPSAAPGRTAQTTFGQDVSPALNQTGTGFATGKVRVFQGAAAEKEFKFE